MNAPEIKLPYRRPKRLSDPHFDNSPSYLAELLARRDEALEWHHYQAILGPYLPAGTYEESAYFLPLAFEFLLKHDKHALDLIRPLVGFASYFAPQLERDRALDAVRARLIYCLEYWTKYFAVNHFDTEACRKKGWCFTYADYVHYTEVVNEAITDLAEFKVHIDLAIQFVAGIASRDADPVKSAWFLEMARRYVENDVYRPPKRVAEFRNLFEDDSLTIHHALNVRDGLPSYAADQTYWRDTFLLLGTTPHMT